MYVRTYVCMSIHIHMYSQYAIIIDVYIYTHTYIYNTYPSQCSAKLMTSKWSPTAWKLACFFSLVAASPTCDVAELQDSQRCWTQSESDSLVSDMTTIDEKSDMGHQTLDHQSINYQP